MKIIISLFVLFLNQFLGDEIDASFITKYEYGAMLYNNPRGIGCNKCHKQGDKVVVIAKYKDRKNIIQTIKAPPISKVSFKDFSKKLKAKKNKSLIMPTYFLTDNEIESIYFYIQKLNKKK